MYIKTIQRLLQCVDKKPLTVFLLCYLKTRLSLKYFPISKNFAEKRTKKLIREGLITKDLKVVKIKNKKKKETNQEKGLPCPIESSYFDSSETIRRIKPCRHCAIKPSIAFQPGVKDRIGFKAWTPTQMKTFERGKFCDDDYWRYYGLETDIEELPDSTPPKESATFQKILDQYALDLESSSFDGLAVSEEKMYNLIKKYDPQVVYSLLKYAKQANQKEGERYNYICEIKTLRAFLNKHNQLVKNYEEQFEENILEKLWGPYKFKDIGRLEEEQREYIERRIVLSYIRQPLNPYLGKGRRSYKKTRNLDYGFELVKLKEVIEKDVNKFAEQVGLRRLPPPFKHK